MWRECGANMQNNLRNGCNLWKMGDTIRNGAIHRTITICLVHTTTQHATPGLLPTLVLSHRGSCPPRFLAISVPRLSTITPAVFGSSQFATVSCRFWLLAGFASCGSVTGCDTDLFQLSFARSGANMFLDICS